MQRLDAPVVGSEDLASKGELVILVGGSRDVFQKYEDFLNSLGKTVLYLGADGNGHKMKLDVNLYLGLIGESFSEALVLAEKQGFDRENLRRCDQQDSTQECFQRGQGPKDCSQKL